VRLSYAFNRWLDIIPTLNVTDRLSDRMTTCTWQFGQKEVPVTYACGLPICPWCRASKLMKAISMFKAIKYKSSGVVFREELDGNKKTVFRQPEHKHCLLALRHVHVTTEGNSVRPVYMAAFFTEEPAEAATEAMGLTYVNWCLKFRLENVLLNAELYRSLNYRVKMITESVKE
jgi:hypothetical protein